MHTLALKGDVQLSQNVSALLSLQGRSLTHLHRIKPKTFLYLGMKPSNWQGCCKLFLGGGNNHHLEGSPISATLLLQPRPALWWIKSPACSFRLLQKPYEETATSQRETGFASDTSLREPVSPELVPAHREGVQRVLFGQPWNTREFLAVDAIWIVPAVYFYMLRGWIRLEVQERIRELAELIIIMHYL